METCEQDSQKNRMKHCAKRQKGEEGGREAGPPYLNAVGHAPKDEVKHRVRILHLHLRGGRHLSNTAALCDLRWSCAGVGMS